MAFHLYPDPATAALRIGPAPSARMDTTIAPFTGPAPSDLAADFSQVMYLRLRTLDGTSAPSVSLRPDQGPPTAVTTERQSLFAGAGHTGFVGQVWGSDDADGSYLVTVGLTAGAAPTGWTVGISNSDITSGHDYVWVVADILADTQQSWVAPPPRTYDLVATVKVGQLARSVAVDPGTGRVYVVQGNDDTVSVLVDRRLSGTLPVGKRPINVVVDPVTHVVYVTNAGDNTVSVIDNATTKAVPVGNVPSGLAIDAVRRRVYVTNDDNRLSVLDADRQQVIATLPTTFRPGNVTVDDESGKAYVFSVDGNTVAECHDEALGAPRTVKRNPHGVDPVFFIANRFGPPIDTSVSPVTAPDFVSPPFLWNTFDSFFGQVYDKPRLRAHFLAADCFLWTVDARTLRGTGGSVNVGDGPTALAVDPRDGTVFVCSRVNFAAQDMVNVLVPG